MSFQTKTWNTNELATSPDFDTYIRDPLNWLATDAPHCRVYRTTDQNISQNVATAVAFDGERYDPQAMHSTVTTSTRITMPVAGVYAFGGCVKFNPGNGDGLRVVNVNLNGASDALVSSRAAGFAVSSAGNIISVSSEWLFAANDYIELVVLQTDSAGTLAINAALHYSPEFWCEWRRTA